ncbi:hypothetical protein V5799_005329 [Amblyomma americanum]|uniref:Uncharacterized protein n=1 Tax=Amblyomma americanum TaxID=6943 RepID=A0AAQ4DZJ9_AMBAM
MRASSGLKPAAKGLISPPRDPAERLCSTRDKALRCSEAFPPEFKSPPRPGDAGAETVLAARQYGGHHFWRGVRPVFERGMAFLRAFPLHQTNGKDMPRNMRRGWSLKKCPTDDWTRRK